MLTYGLQLTVTADLAWQGLRSKLAKSAKSKTKNGGGADDDDDDELLPESMAYYYTMRLFLILGTGTDIYARSRIEKFPGFMFRKK